jgi:hypothetical protein
MVILCFHLHDEKSDETHTEFFQTKQVMLPRD